MVTVVSVADMPELHMGRSRFLFCFLRNTQHTCLGALGIRWDGTEWDEACLQTDALTSEEHGRRLEDVTIAFGGCLSDSRFLHILT